MAATEAEYRNLECSKFFADTATTVAAVVNLSPQPRSNVACREFTLVNTGTIPLSFSLDGQTVWMPLAPGAFFDWHRPLYAVAIKTLAGTTTYAIAAGY